MMERAKNLRNNMQIIDLEGMVPQDHLSHDQGAFITQKLLVMVKITTIIKGQARIIFHCIFCN